MNGDHKIECKARLSGFTLIELMVAVAIIGVLALIAAPQYKKYEIRARMAEAKTALSTVFVIQKSAHAEYGTYVSCLGAFGFDIYHRWNCANNDLNRKNAYYNTGVTPDDGNAGWGNVAVQNIALPSCISGQYDCSPSKWYFRSAGGDRMAVFCNGGGNGMWDQSSAMFSDPAFTNVTVNTFKAVAAGPISTCPGTVGSYANWIAYSDIWTIDENKTLIHVKEP